MGREPIARRKGLSDMRLLTGLCVLACVATLSGTALAGAQKRGYMLRDTTSLPPPAAGKARLLVARDMTVTQEFKPEMVFADHAPVGLLPQKAAVTAEIDPGWHRVWLGRGGNAEVWMNFEAGQGYLLRLREIGSEGYWAGDLVRESSEGYSGFAVGRGMKLAVMDERGRGALERNLGKPSNKDALKDSTARARAIELSKLPIEVKEAWYLPFPSEVAPSDYQNKPGRLTLDEKSLRFTRGDSTVIEIPRADITSIRFGSQRGGGSQPWIKLGYKFQGNEIGAIFADTKVDTATETYNRLFAELAKNPVAP